MAEGSGFTVEEGFDVSPEVWCAIFLAGGSLRSDARFPASASRSTPDVQWIILIRGGLFGRLPTGFGDALVAEIVWGIVDGGGGASDIV